MTYTRFLDLKKAEAQAREGEIELALERVRSRTMAMQHSNELPEAATILFQQMQTLGMPAWSAGYCIWNDDKTAVTLWMSSEGVLQPPFTAPTTEDELFIEMRKGQEQGKTFHVVQMGGDKLAKHYKYMRTLPVVGEILDSIINAGHPLPTFQIMHHNYFSNGFLLYITYEPVPPTHLAVALKYDAKANGAPVVVAKGAGFIAEKIREIGRQHGVMIVENKLVARTLYKLVDVGREVPEDLYRAVAEILAFVYRVRGKLPPA